MTLATNVAIALLTLATGSISARLLGPTGRGELSAIQTIPSFLGMLALLGLPSAVGYFSAQDPVAARALTLTAIALGLVSSSVVMALGFVGMPWALGRQSATTVGDARFYLLFIGLQAVQAVPYLALQGLGRFRAWNILRLAPNLCWLVALALGWELHRATAGWLSRSYLLAYGLTIPLVIGTLWSASEGRTRIAKERIRPMLRYGVPSAASALPSALNLRMDQMLMAALLDPRLLGLYAVGVSWSGAMAPVFGALGSTVFPALAASRDEAAKTELLGRTLRVAVVLALVLGSALAIVTPVFFPLLFGRRFLPALIPTLVLIAAAVVLSVNSVLEEILRGVGGPEWPMYAQFAALPLTVGLLFVTLERWQLMGAAIASLVSYAAAFVVMALGLKKMSGVSVLSLVRPQPGDRELLRTTVSQLFHRIRNLIAPSAPS